MKIRIFFLLFVSFLLSFANVPFANAEDSRIYSEGEHIGNASSYYYGGSLYLNAGQIARTLGGKTDYLPASGKLLISARRMKAIFSVNKGKVIINGQKIVFSEPLIIRAGIPFVLAKCFESEDMAAAYGGHITFSSAMEETSAPENTATMPISGEHSCNTAAVPAVNSSPAANSGETVSITALRSGNHADKTRLVIQLSSPAAWQHSRSGNILIIGIPESIPDNEVLSSAAAVRGQEILSADIASNRTSNGRPFTAITVRLADTAGEINIFSLSGPSRIVADVYNVNASFDKNEAHLPESNAASVQKDSIPAALPSSDNGQNGPLKKVVPMASVSEEMFFDPDIYDENTEGIIYEEDDISSLPELVPLDSKNTVPANAQTATAVSKAKKEVNALKTKSKKGNTVKKVKSSPDNSSSADIPSSVMAGLKASGLDYSSSKQTEKKTQELPQKSVSSALAVRKPQAKKAVSSAAVSGKRIIVIDPSHGGKDSGGQKKFGLSEKQYSLLLAMEIQNMFEENESFQVVLTRNDDSFLPLARRSSMANEIKADLFISLHGDSSKGYNAKGFSVYSFSETGSDSDALETAYRENASTELESENERPSAAALAADKASSQKEESRRLAGIVASELARGTTLKNNGVHQANFMLLRLVEAPSIFVFAGHMTNSADKKIMDDKHSRKRIARSIYNGIMSYSDMKGWTKK